MRRQGLTVVEALTATAIVMVVLAVGYPAARALGARSQHEACGERLHTLGAALAMYANDHEGWLPAATTAESPYRGSKGVPDEALFDSPHAMRAAMEPYAAQENAWFCPVDVRRGDNGLWFGQRHRFAGYRVDPFVAGEERVWPPHAQLSKVEVLASDPVGGPGPASSHDDGMVNAVRGDLSLFRRSARAWMRETPLPSGGEGKG